MGYWLFLFLWRLYLQSQPLVWIGWGGQWVTFHFLHWECKYTSIVIPNSPARALRMVLGGRISFPSCKYNGKSKGSDYVGQIKLMQIKIRTTSTAADNHCHNIPVLPVAPALCLALGVKLGIYVCEMLKFNKN